MLTENEQFHQADTEIFSPTRVNTECLIPENYWADLK